MKPNNLIVGMDFSELDHKLCSYVNFLAEELPIDHVNNLFVFTARELFHQLQEVSAKSGDLLLKAFGEKMHERFDSCFPNIKHVKNHALAGLFIEMFYHQFNKSDTDLIVVGKKRDSHGIMAKYIIRHIPAYTLIVPEGSEHKLSNIVIALEQSELSKRILHRALDFCSLLKTKPTVTCLHVGHLPYYSDLGDEIFEDYKKFGAKDIKKIYEVFFEKQKQSFENFVRINSEGFEDINIKTEFIAEKRVKPYMGLKDYVNSGKTDFLIMGTRSHTVFDTLFLGSFVEKMISVNDKVPMLIVK